MEYNKRNLADGRPFHIWSVKNSASLCLHRQEIRASFIQMLKEIEALAQQNGISFNTTEALSVNLYDYEMYYLSGNPNDPSIGGGNFHQMLKEYDIDTSNMSIEDIFVELTEKVQKEQLADIPASPPARRIANSNEPSLILFSSTSRDSDPENEDW